MAFSAMHSARRSGKMKFISTGHSVPGVIWNRMQDAVERLLLAGVGDLEGGRDQADRTRATSSDRGRRRSGRAGPFSSWAPYMYSARRFMAAPA